MKHFFKVITWTAIVAGAVALPILIKKRMEETVRQSENIRYDINDYISESGL